MTDQTAEIEVALRQSGLYGADFVAAHSHGIALALRRANLSISGGPLAPAAPPMQVGVESAPVSAAEILNTSARPPLPISTTVMYPGPQCPCCHGNLTPFGRNVVARVLRPTGWDRVVHQPVRCRNPRCERVDKYIWHNYVAMGGRSRLWTWPDEELEYFFVCASWGVTTAWLRQMSQRIVHHFASFAGEAAVHKEEARRNGHLTAVPPKAAKKLLHAWLFWRLVVRVHDHSADVAPTQPAPPIDLYGSPGPALAAALPWYAPFMLQRRLRHLEQGGQDPSILVIDGNCKLSRRICGRDCADFMAHSGLNAQTVVRCGRTPVCKGQRCAFHAAGAGLQTNIPMCKHLCI